MATTKVSALSAKGTLGGSEEILINDGGTSKKATITAVRTGITDATKLPLAGGQMTGNITMSGSQTVDGRDISADGTQLDTNTSAIATKAPIASPTFTGTVAIPNIGNLEAAVAANTAKVTNATHTGDVTGATALTIADDAVTAAKLANSINTDIATGVTANTTANAALPKSGGAMTGAITTNSTFDGRDVATDGTKLDGIEASADVTDATNVASAGALMKSGGTMTGSAHGSTDTDTSNTGSVTLNFTTNQNFVLTLTGNVTLANPTTETVGQSGFITFIQDGTGSRTVGLGTDYETAGGAGLTLTSTASATDIVPYVVVASGRILLGTPQLAFA